MRIADYIGETTAYDKKVMLETKKPKSWLKSVSAFANTFGGALIFGVDDDGELKGLDDVKFVSEKISEIVKEKLDPIPQMNMEIHSEDGKNFLILKVPEGKETPYYYVGDGNRTAFVRMGNQSTVADAAALKRLVLKGEARTYDSLPSKYKFEDYAFTKLKSVYRKRTGNELMSDDFISFGLIERDGYLTNAGILLADDSPVYQSRLFCTRWNGLDKASGVIDAVDDKEFSGSLITILQNGEEFVKNNTKKMWKKAADTRIEMPDYPERAVLECLVNALIHRDYMDMSSEVHIDIFDDRMEIYSPGGMIDGSTVQELDTDKIPSRRRNPVIADVFSRMNYMERRGSGFKKIKNDYRTAENYTDALAPVFYSSNSSFIVTLYNLNYHVSMKKALIGTEKVLIDDEKVLIDDEKVLIDDKKVLIEMLNGLDITEHTKENILILYREFGDDIVFGRTEISATCNVGISAAGKIINKLKNSNLIEPVKGFGKGKYKFSKIK